VITRCSTRLAWLLALVGVTSLLACSPAARGVEIPIVIVGPAPPLPLAAAETAQEPARAAALAGTWKEHWGDGALGYNDTYRVRVSGDTVTVEPIGASYEIREVRAGAGTLSFVQQTAFEVRYELRLDARGELVGTATTPEGTYPIRWERLGEDRDAPVPSEDDDHT
jgi:hypothetical protein